MSGQGSVVLLQTSLPEPKAPFAIRILVPDGDPEGVHSIDRMNWTGLGDGPGLKVRVERIIRNWFENQTELNQKLKGILAALWEEAVVRPLERLPDESAGELPEDIRPANVVPFASRVPA